MYCCKRPQAPSSPKFRKRSCLPGVPRLWSATLSYHFDLICSESSVLSRWTFRTLTFQTFPRFPRLRPVLQPSSDIWTNQSLQSLHHASAKAKFRHVHVIGTWVRGMRRMSMNGLDPSPCAAVQEPTYRIDKQLFAPYKTTYHLKKIMLSNFCRKKHALF